MLTTPTRQYDSELIRSLIDTTCRMPRCTRKLLFHYGLWRPAYARRRVKLAEPAVSPSTGLPGPPPPPRIEGGRVATWNIHSLSKKYLAVADTILAKNIDLLVVTESWHRSSADVAIRRSSPPGFNFIDRPRPGALDDPPGGGLVFYHRDTRSTKRISLSPPPTTFEALAVTVSTCRGPLVVLAVYRPGSSPPTRA